MFAKVHDDALFVNKNIERYSSSQMKNGIKTGSLSVGQVKILYPLGYGVDIIRPIIYKEIDNSQWPSLKLLGQA